MWNRVKLSAREKRRAGLFFDDTRMAIASIDNERNLFAYDAVRQREDHDLNHTIARFGMDDRGLAELTSVLPSGSYQLLLVNLPDVPQNELKSAVKWQIKDLLDFPAEEAVIELFGIPEHSNPGAKPTAYAVAARRSTLAGHVNQMHNSGLKPTAIDIPELCLRNVAALLPQDADGVALLHFSAHKGTLTVTRQGLLYFFRHFDVGYDELAGSTSDAGAPSNDLSSVVLDVKRSLDYYESHYDRRPVTELILATGGNVDPLPDLLRQQLGLSVNWLDLGKFFELRTDLPQQQQSECLLAIGAALRTQSLAA